MPTTRSGTTPACVRAASRDTATSGFEALDLFGESFISNPFPALASLRRDAPVHYEPHTGLWLISGYHDVRRVLLDPDHYLPDNAQNVVTRLSMPTLRILARAGFSLPPALANNSGPAHQGLRRLVARFLHAGHVAAAVPLIEAVAQDLLLDIRERLDAGHVCDLASEYARLLPCQVLLRLLGVESVPPARLLTWSDSALELFYGWPCESRQTQLATSVVEFHQWISRQFTAGAPKAGLIGALGRHRLPGGEPLDVPTAVAVCFFVLVAGQSTTGHLISTALRTALADVSAWERAAVDDDFTEGYVEEVLRREPPVTTWRRTTASAVDLSGVQLPAGAQLLLMLMGTGSDPEIFPEPGELLPHRPHIRHHLSFGAGRHRCPGAILARTEAALAVRAAARLLPAARPLDGRRPPILGLLSFRAPLRVAVRRVAGQR